MDGFLDASRRSGALQRELGRTVKLSSPIPDTNPEAT